jgi:hypothetical protein
MLYVAILDWQPGLSAEQRDGALGRRAMWSYPDGLEVKGEYWPASGSPAVISIFEADRYEPIMELLFTWGDVFDIRVSPTTTPEEGLAIGQGVMERSIAARAAAPTG